MRVIKKSVSILALVFIATIYTGCVSLGTKLDNKAMGAYLNMWESVNEYGDPAKAMMLEFEVDKDVSTEDVDDAIRSMTLDYNMRLVDFKEMPGTPNAKANEVKRSLIWSLCSLSIANEFLNHSRYFGGFMPCRIMMVEYGDGRRYLITMDLTLAIHGGFPLNEKMLKLANHVKKAMTEIPARAAKDDF